jgi:hypothetical protein
MANSGGHKCITNISGMSYLLSKSKKQQSSGVEYDPELAPIAEYSGKNTFVNDIKGKLLKFGTLSPKQIEIAMSIINKEGGITQTEQKEGYSSYVELTKAIQDEFVKVLNGKIESQQGLQESVNKKDNVVDLLKSHVNKNKKLSESDWDYIIKELECVIDSRGQWDHPGKCTMIESNRITMKNVDFPLVGIDDTGHMKFMLPEMEYSFPGKKVFEIPLKGKYKKIGLELLKF